jgi:hypothetical protein
VSAGRCCCSAPGGFLVGYVTTRTRLTLVFAAFDRSELASFVDARYVPGSSATASHAAGAATAGENEPEVDLGRLRRVGRRAGQPGQAFVLARTAQKVVAGTGERGTVGAPGADLSGVDAGRPAAAPALGQPRFRAQDMRRPITPARSALDQAIKRRGNRLDAET